MVFASLLLVVAWAGVKTKEVSFFGGGRDKGFRLSGIWKRVAYVPLVVGR